MLKPDGRCLENPPLSLLGNANILLEKGLSVQTSNCKIKCHPHKDYVTKNLSLFVIILFTKEIGSRLVKSGINSCDK